MVTTYDDYGKVTLQRTIVNRCFILLIVLGIVIISLAFNEKINIQQAKHQVLSEKYDDLVARLSANCPGGAYIVEPIETEKQLEVDKLEILDIAKLFGSN